MAMKLNQGGKFTRRGVVIEIANEKGTWEKNTLDVTFESADTDELDELRELKAKELLQRKLKGWSACSMTTAMRSPTRKSTSPASWRSLQRLSPSIAPSGRALSAPQKPDRGGAVVGR